MIPYTNTEKEKNARLLALGELMPEINGERLALDTLRRSGSVREFMQAANRELENRSLLDLADNVIGLDTARDAGGYSVLSLIRDLMERKPIHQMGLEGDISNLITTRTGAVPNGAYAPLQVLVRDFNVGTASEAGNLTGAGVLGTYAQDPLRAASVLARMGATFIPGQRSTVSAPLFQSSTTPTYLGEIETLTEVSETTSAQTLSPKRVAVKMVMSRQAVIQGTPALDLAVKRHLTRAILQGIESGALTGDGSGNNPTGVLYHSGAGLIVGGTDGATLAYSHLCDLEDGPGTSNAEDTPNSGYILSSAVRRYLRTLSRGSGLDYVWSGGERPLLGHRAGVTNLMPDDLVKGASGAVCSGIAYSSDWSMLLIALYPAIDVMVDRITLAHEGKIKVIASVEVGAALALPEAFSVMLDAKRS